MPDTFYPEAQETARALLQEFGQDIIVRRITIKKDPTEQTDKSRTQIEQTLTGVQLPALSEKTGMFDKRRMTTGIGKKDTRFVILAGIKTDGSPADFAPEAGDVMLLESKEWTIEQCNPLRPSGDHDIIYKIAITLGAKKGATP